MFFPWSHWKSSPRRSAYAAHGPNCHFGFQSPGQFNRAMTGSRRDQQQKQSEEFRRHHSAILSRFPSLPRREKRAFPNSFRSKGKASSAGRIFYLVSAVHAVPIIGTLTDSVATAPRALAVREKMP